jgi:hypothetical protein
MNESIPNNVSHTFILPINKNAKVGNAQIHHSEHQEENI